LTPICLIVPPSAFLLDQRVFVSLGILKVAAVLEQAGHPVEVLDLSGVENFTDAVRAHARRSRPQVCGITATSPQMPAATRIVEVLREEVPAARLILGGPHVTLVHAAARKKSIRAVNSLLQLARTFDVLVAGDGEDAIFEAIKPDAPALIDADDPKGPWFLTSQKLEETPFPARHLVDVSSYHYSIEGEAALSMIAQLGCPFPLRLLRGSGITHAAPGANQEQCQHRRRGQAPPRPLRREGDHVLR
jgi:anaerobic magnesium-protoporphyrin IX monomethyl ester cyclase